MSLKLTGLTPLIEVFDMLQALHFYRDLLGFEVISVSPEVETPEGRLSHWTWLRRDGAELMLNTAYDAGERPVVRDVQRQQAHRDTGLFIGCADVDAVYRALLDKGLRVEPPVRAPYGLKRFEVSDPDGYMIVFQEVP